MKTNRLQKVLAVVLVLALCFGLMISVFAVDYSGTSAKAVTFSVKTGNSDGKLSFTQSKGTLKYNNLVGTAKTMSVYDSFQIKYQKNDSKACYAPKTVTMNGGKCTLKLDKNSTYKITVTPAAMSTLQRENGGLLGITKYITGWKSYAKWYVAGTNGLHWYL